MNVYIKTFDFSTFFHFRVFQQAQDDLKLGVSHILELMPVGWELLSITFDYGSKKDKKRVDIDNIKQFKEVLKENFVERLQHPKNHRAKYRKPCGMYFHLQYAGKSLANRIPKTNTGKTRKVKPIQDDTQI